MRKCEYMKPPEHRTMRMFQTYFKHMQEQAPRTLKRFRRYDSRMQELRETQRAERSRPVEPAQVHYVCHVCTAATSCVFQCQMHISKLRTWRGKPPEGYTAKTWWLKARSNAERWMRTADGARGIFAVLKSHWLKYKRARAMNEHSIVLDAEAVDFLHDFYNPGPFLLLQPHPLRESKFTSATLATLAFEQQCGRYICMDCCVRERMPRNLDFKNNSYCRTCYHRGTRREDYVRHTQAQRELKSLSYCEQRPIRIQKRERPPPKPSALITDRSANALWVGGTGRQLIQDEPLNGATYTYSEINGLLKSVENFFYNRTTNLQVLYTVETDISRPWDLTRAECYHHFGRETVLILEEELAVAPNGKFVLPEDLENYDDKAEQDEQGESDCELID
jgi:hypothetical protein